jgi:RHS repeat-associated protein
VKTYEWNAENRLVTVKQGGNTLASFTYDGIGRRATKSAGGIGTTYLYGGTQFLEERQSTGSTNRYVYAAGIDRPLAQASGAAITYYVADHLGSIIRTTDPVGNPTLTREYDPWGNPIQGAATGGYAFTGREWDSETGLYYYRARYHDPQIGRFISEDPIRFRGGINFYSYVHNNPTNLVDPWGLCVPRKPNCPELFKLIQDLVWELIKRRYDIEYPKYLLPQSGPMSVEGHQQQFRNKQLYLQRLVDDYTNRCGPPPPGAPEMLKEPVPAPQDPIPINPWPPWARDAQPQDAAAGMMIMILIVLIFLPVGA